MSKYLLAISLILNWFLYELADSYAQDTAGYNYAVNYLVEDLQMARTMTEVTLDLMDDYKHANQQLIEHCEPKSVNKAILSTPLPKLVKKDLV